MKTPIIEPKYQVGDRAWYSIYAIKGLLKMPTQSLIHQVQFTGGLWEYYVTNGTIYIVKQESELWSSLEEYILEYRS